METVAVGIGSNQGDSLQICTDAIGLLRKHPSVRILRTSSFYRTKPVGFTEQDWFVNAAVLCETDLKPGELLDVLLNLEQDFGRVRTTRWGPRTLDLDLLFFGIRQVDEPHLKIPHPLMQERLFVLAPLAEIVPDWVHPVLGFSVRTMRDRLLKTDRQQEIQKLDT